MPLAPHRPEGANFKKVRGIKPAVERELWARAGGCCQFQGCNDLVYKSCVTHEKVNVAEMAHIYAFSADARRTGGLANDSDVRRMAAWKYPSHAREKTMSPVPQGAGAFFAIDGE